MDRRLDKRYLTGAVSAMEKQYGAEKTDAIIEDAWRRYAEIVDENADEPKKMYMHTRKRIYPAIAAFDAMTGNGISREEAAAFLNRYYEKRAAGVGAKIRGAMRIPGLYKLMPKFFAKMTKSSFGEDCGFRANWIRTEREEMCFDMLACPYQDTCVKYGCPEIVAGFCRADDEAYGHMHPKLKWGRTKTLGQGGDCCDFRLTITENGGMDLWTKRKSGRLRMLLQRYCSPRC